MIQVIAPKITFLYPRTDVINLDERPVLVFWETTRACDLACRHCRASAIPRPLPGELSHAEGLDLIDQVADFGFPRPVLILTGGDVLKRDRLWELVAYARRRGIPLALSPSVTPRLTPEVLDRMAEAEIRMVSFSLDAADPAGHDGLRGVPGTWARTLDLAAQARRRGLKVQINTAVMDWNYRDLPAVFGLVREVGARAWEVFFHIPQGRGSGLSAPAPLQGEAVCRFLVEASRYGVAVRTVEAPFFRRVARQVQRDEWASPAQELAAVLLEDLYRRLGPPPGPPAVGTACTRDGRGIVFVNYRGEVHPSGFLPVSAGDVRSRPLARLYRESPLFQKLRSAEGFGGRCGACPYRHLCGGSRARAFAATGDPLAEDPACAYDPLQVARR